MSALPVRKIQPLKPIENYFGGMHYTTPGAVMAHALQISDAINAALKPSKPLRIAPPRREQPKPPLSPFHIEITQIAPSFIGYRGAQYNVKAVTEAWLKQQGIKATGEATRTNKIKVQGAIAYLKQIGAIGQSERVNREKLRDASSKEIEKHAGIIRRVLARPKYGVSGWIDVMDRREMKAAALAGLKRGLETFDQNHPSKASLETHLFNCVASSIASEVRTRKGAEKKERQAGVFSLDAPARKFSHGGDLTGHETYGNKPFDPSAVESSFSTLFDLYSRGRAKPQWLVIHALRGFGHHSNEIGPHFGTSGQNIRRMLKVIDENIKRAEALQERKAARA